MAGMIRKTYERIITNLPKVNLETGEIFGCNEYKPDKDGYRQIGLGGSPVKHHQVLAVARWGEACIGMTVNHINEDKLDNSRHNLELVSHKTNMQYRTKLGRTRGKTPIKAINLKTGETFCFESTAEACRVLGFINTGVSKVLSGFRNHHKGYTFERVEK